MNIFLNMELHIRHLILISLHHSSYGNIFKLNNETDVQTLTILFLLKYAVKGCKKY